MFKFSVKKPGWLLVGLLMIWPRGVDAQELPIHSILLPPGFEISVYADDVPHARSLEVSPSGVVYVGNRKGDKVYALIDKDKDHVAETVKVVAEGLWQPVGVDFHDGDLYIGEINRVVKLIDIENHLDHPPEPVVVYDQLPDETWHGWKFIKFGPDGKLYIPIGAPCNVCDPEDPRFATITRMNPDGTDFEVFARGIRNSVGFDWHPQTGELWFTDNGRDMMGDNLPPDELNHAPKEDLHFGFPFCHGGFVLDLEFGDERSCQEFRPPAQILGPHVAALGMRFYTGNMFPKQFQNQIFIAEHGSWNRSEKIGYRVMMVTLDENNAVSYQPFATGWKQGEKVWGRPVDVEIMPDGALLVSDDYAGAVYRIIYRLDVD